VTRPITVALRQGERLPAGWEAEARALPGVTAVAGGTVAGDGAPAGPVLRVDSTDLRATTPALLGWLRVHQLALASMRAEPVTLSDVFAALAERRAQAPDERP
jgi:hypothetical protein